MTLAAGGVQITWERSQPEEREGLVGEGRGRGRGGRRRNREGKGGIKEWGQNVPRRADAMAEK